VADDKQGKFDFEGNLGRRPKCATYTPPPPKPPTRWELLVGAIRRGGQKLRAIARWVRRRTTWLRIALMVGTALLVIFGGQWVVEYGSERFMLEVKKKPPPAPAKPEPAKPQPWEIMIEREKR
jgi:hypothetical protein